MLWIELAVLLLCLAIGARLGGIGLGTVSGLGLVLFVFVFRLPPGGPPATVLGMIVAVITAVSAMEAAGGLDYLVGAAGRLMSGRPRQITFIAPLVTYALVFASGTQHVVYALLPVIAEVARNAGVRPERPLSASVVASQCGVIASPIAAATVALAGLLAGANVSVSQILLVTVPATLAGLLFGTLSVAWRGEEIAPASGPGVAPAAVASASLDGEARRRALGSCLVFGAAILVVIALGLIPGARPMYERVSDDATEFGQVEMGRAIMIVMLAAAGLIMLLFKASPDAALKGRVMKGGLVAVISILGVSWLGSSFFEGNQPAIVRGLSSVVQSHPWVFALAMFALSVLLFSRAAAVVTLIPVGQALGLPPPVLLGAYTAANGTFFLPTYGTVLAAVSFDSTGTTRIGKYLFDHSFMRPGLVATTTAALSARVLAQWLLG